MGTSTHGQIWTPRTDSLIARSEPYNILFYGGTGCGEGGIDGDVLMIVPPFTIKEDEVDLIVDRATRVINDYFASPTGTP